MPGEEIIRPDGVAQACQQRGDVVTAVLGVEAAVAAGLIECELTQSGNERALLGRGARTAGASPRAPELDPGRVGRITRGLRSERHGG